MAWQSLDVQKYPYGLSLVTFQTPPLPPCKISLLQMDTYLKSIQELLEHNSVAATNSKI